MIRTFFTVVSGWHYSLCGWPRQAPNPGMLFPLVARKTPLINERPNVFSRGVLSMRSFADAEPAEYLAEQIVRCEYARDNAELLLCQSQFFGHQVQCSIFFKCKLLLS